jgi:tetratricopeptide (TPR) repeat protein
LQAACEKERVHVPFLLLVLLAVRSYPANGLVDAKFYRQTSGMRRKRTHHKRPAWSCEKGRCPEALEYYEHALSLNPRTPPALHNSAICYAAMGNLKKAEEYLNKNISQAPDFHYSYFTLLELYVKSGQKSKAKTLLENVMLRKFPGDPELQTIYGSL